MEQADRTRTSGTLIAVGAAVAGGWLLYDLTKVAVSSNPVAFLGLLPGVIAPLALGAAFGWAASKRAWFLPAALVLLGLASVAPKLIDLHQPPIRVWLPRIALLMSFAFLLAQPAAVRRRFGTLRPGLALGFLACHAKTVAVMPGAPIPLPLVACIPIAALAGALKPTWMRYAATALALAYPALVVQRLAQAHASSGRPDLPHTEVAASPGAPNLLLIVLDTVRADRLAPYGYERQTTPRLDAFVREHAIRYERARSTGSYTLPSHASMLTGLFSSEHGADHPRSSSQEIVPRDFHRPAVSLRPDVPTLGEQMRERGYRTGAIVANSAYLHHTFGIARGFDHYDDRDGAWLRGYITLPQYLGWRPRIGHKVFRDGGIITDEALSWIGSNGGGKPFFLMLNYMDAHTPYIPPAATAGAFEDAQPMNLLDPDMESYSLLYDRCLLALDSHLGRLLDELTASGLLETTVVIITSDHGESLGDHDYWNHAWNLYEELVRVPLYVKPLGAREREVDDTLVTSIHIPYLALSAMGLTSGPGPDVGGLTSEWYHGKSNPAIDRWAADTGRDVETDLLAWFEGDTKYIVGSGGRVQAFDIASDPRELDELELSDEEIEAALARARKWWADHPPIVAEESELAPDVLDRLRDLGYMGDE